MDTLFDVQLTQDQRSLLTAIAHPWLARGEWPLWANVQHEYDLRGEDADAVYNSLPRIGIEGPFAAGYGFTFHPKVPTTQTHRPMLTVAACLVLPEMRKMFGEPFVRALRYMIDRWDGRPVLDDQVPPVLLRSGELMAALPDLTPWFVQVLPYMLSQEPGINTGGAHIGDGSWERQITRSVTKFRGVETVEDYIAKTTEIVQANAAELVPPPLVPEVPPAAEPARGTYVEPGLLDDLDSAAKGTRWRVHKLIALCQGLNDAYTAENPYVCAAMIRAILDHISPAFGGHSDFKHVVAQHSFSRTDRAHAADLAASKSIGDDAMHRPIGSQVRVITMDDIPRPIRLNAVLNELLTILQKGSPST